MEEKFKSFTAKEMKEYLERNRIASDDEWLELNRWFSAFFKSNPSEEEKKMFPILGYPEMAGMMADGITRWRNSICIKCKNQKDYSEYSCSIHQKNEKRMGGIPNEIWANENAECPYYEPKA